MSDVSSLIVVNENSRYEKIRDLNMGARLAGPEIIGNTSSLVLPI